VVIYDIPESEELKINSSPIPIEPDKVYQLMFKARGIKGNENSAYVLIIFSDDKKEVQRRIRKIKDWSNIEHEYSIISATPFGSKQARAGFRINCQGAVPAHTVIDIPPVEELRVLEVSNDSTQTYDEHNDYTKLWEKIDLEKNYWRAVGAFNDEQKFIKDGKNKLQILKNAGLKPDSKILDVGCGTGTLVKHLADYLESTKNYVGTDISLKAINFCKKRYQDFRFYVNETTELPKFNEKFDMICLFSVFTHIYPDKTRDFLKNIKAVLAPSGCIVATIFENPYLKTFTDTIGKIEYNRDYFSDIVRSTGFTKISKLTESEKMKQVPYKIQIN